MKRGIHFEVVWFGLLPGLTFEFKQSTRTFSFLGITLYATTNESCPIAYSMIEGYVRKRSTKRADEVGGRTDGAGKWRSLYIVKISTQQ